MKVDLSKHECSSQLNGICLHTDLRRTLEGKEYRLLNILSFVFLQEDTWKGFSEEAPLIRIHVQ